MVRPGSPLLLTGPGNHRTGSCRWARYFAPEDVVGGFPARVESGTVNDPGNKKTWQVDVAVFGTGTDDREAILAIGEAKWHETMGMGHLERLRRIRGLLTAQGRRGAAVARLLCFSGAGFSPELTDEAARSNEIRLLSPADLYTGILLPVTSTSCRPTAGAISTGALTSPDLDAGRSHGGRDAGEGTSFSAARKALSGPG